MVIYPAGTPLVEATADNQEELMEAAWPITIMERTAKYVEEWTCRNSSRAVQHRLTYTTQHGVETLSDGQIDWVMRHGVVADLTLASGAVIRVGGNGFSLRLKSVDFSSGSVPLDVPQKIWVWESTDTTPLI